MKHIFTAVAFGAFAITSTAIAQPSHVDTCNSTDCENGLAAVQDALGQDIIDQVISEYSLDDSYPDHRTADEIKQCMRICSVHFEESVTACVAVEEESFKRTHRVRRSSDRTFYEDEDGHTISFKMKAAARSCAEDFAPVKSECRTKCN